MHYCGHPATLCAELARSLSTHKSPPLPKLSQSPHFFSFPVTTLPLVHLASSRSSRRPSSFEFHQECGERWRVDGVRGEVGVRAVQGCRDACATVDCGLDAHCSAADDGSTECLCGVIGYAFNEATKTCIDPCPSVQCPEKAECVARGGKGECECELGYIMQNGACTDGLLQTRVEVEGLNYLSLLTFESPVPMAQATGATACTNVSDLGGSNTRITVEWTSIGVDTVGNGMCKSVSFHADPVCADKPGLTIARPGLTKVGGFFPVTTR
ncbi:unnamed protein product [Closterium sp. Naga37s-1]|nr:unnamed protein product [Closterium sp. Naga37s-1]